MILRSNLKSSVALLAACALGAATMAMPLAAENSAESSESSQGQVAASTLVAATYSNEALARFAPATIRGDHRIDYTHWDEALQWFVIPMGPSLRQQPPPIAVSTGSRRVYGHESRYRLEGNRVAFSYMTGDVISSVSEYRADLERVGTELDLASLPRNEQLAYWLNLHNVAVIEALAGQYPMREPYERTFGANGASLDDAKLVTVDGVALSPRDIREGIVFANWNDPKVMYGFWRGVIDGPSIQRVAFTGDNVDALLALSAEEFVNSLRGVERWGGALRVSPFYEESASFFFPNSDSLRTHMAQYARDDVRDLIMETSEVRYKWVEGDIADLQRGEREPQLNFLFVRECRFDACAGAAGTLNAGGNPPSIRINPAISRFMRERAIKLERARREGIRTGMVIYGDTGFDEDETPREVE